MAFVDSDGRNIKNATDRLPYPEVEYAVYR